MIKSIDEWVIKVSFAEMCILQFSLVEHYQDIIIPLRIRWSVSMICHEMSQNIPSSTSSVNKCHEMCFNLTWWHLMTCHDVINLIRRGFRLHLTSLPDLVSICMFTNTCLCLCTCLYVWVVWVVWGMGYLRHEFQLYTMRTICWCTPLPDKMSTKDYSF